MILGPGGSCVWRTQVSSYNTAYNNVVFPKPCWVISDTLAFFLGGETTSWDKTPWQLMMATEKGKKCTGEAGGERVIFLKFPLIETLAR